MKFWFENLGLIDRAELELGELTLICGENNTGKTYVTYAIYGFLRSWRRLLALALASQIESIASKEGAYKFDLQEMFSGQVNGYLEKLTGRYAEILPQVFGASDSLLAQAKIGFRIAVERNLLPIAFQRTIKEGPAGKVLATVTKNQGSSVLEVLIADDAGVRSPFGGLSDFVVDAIGDIVFSHYLPETFIASAERTGAAIFRKELDFARTRMIEALGTLDAKELRNPLKLLQSMDAGYAWPVQDNVDFVRQLEDIDKQTGLLAKAHPELLPAFESIIGGSYKVIKDKGLFFQPKGAKSPRLSMTESSSCVRALLDIGFYVRCRAKAGDLFMIDEPELNLHPTNQRALARLIARMVNHGVRVFITTHSDYLIKEINTLIMLAQRTKLTRTVQEKHGYAEEDLLDPSQVKLYMTCTDTEKRQGKRSRTRFNTLRQAVIYPDQGIEVTTFDTTIDEMNAIQSEILYGGDTILYGGTAS